MPDELMPECETDNHAQDGLTLFGNALDRARDLAAIHYFGGSLSYGDVHRLSSAFARLLSDRGFVKGDRLALFLQNTPHVLIALVAAWKIGGICVPINPMNGTREVSLILADCQPRALIALDALIDPVITTLAPALMPPILVTVRGDEFAAYPDARVFGSVITDAEITSFALLQGAVDAIPVEPDDLALLVYTSGTTGKPKGAMISHRAFAFNAGAFEKVAGLATGDPILGIAPLFHITGLVAGIGLAMRLAAPLILTFRFDTAVVIEAIDRWQPRFVVAATTAFVALFNDSRVTPECLAGLTYIFSGGAPVPPAFVEQFEARMGRYIHNCYGLTETASATHITPFGTRAPVSECGVLSIGRPVPGARARIVDDAGNDLDAGATGELVVQGPMVSTGYWMNPTETAASMRPDGFRTGDIAFRDAEGWYYLVDRKKDVIISSGYKVWPREVEDVLYAHLAVREAAVIGVPDAYRGESVKAVVSLKPGMAATPDELLAFCKARMAAYKYPRSVVILDALPKTVTGKILRRALRALEPQ